MGIIFFGTPHFAIPSLKALLDAKENIILVVTQPDKKKGRGHILTSPPIKDFAQSFNLLIQQPVDIKKEDFCHQIKNLTPELIVVVAYGKLLPKEILTIPSLGCINVHASLLPKYRGAAPIQWTLINGEKETGITTMLMDEGLDTGDILLQKTINIDPNDNYESLSQKLAQLGANTLLETIYGLRNNKIRPKKQTGQATYAPPLKKTDGRINWTKTALEIHNLIKGLYPWPSAYTFLNNERIKIIKAYPIEGEGEPGRVENTTNEQIIVGTAKGLLVIEEVQPEGKKIMRSSAFLQGRKIKEKDDRFI
ncbi:MAG: methionyl-tRNA formyltransferase [Thermodesulfovibrionales bacterium]|nr:methionyl-tRNA formyltransferase [Thermodesulfovibrionales bacterium]